MHNNNLLSVIILVYNNLEYLSECVQSVCEQSYDNIELIIGDDNSSNFSFHCIFEIILKYAGSNINSVTVYNNETNVGIVKNYIKALSYAKGEYIFYLPADDKFYDNTVLEDVYNAFISSKYLILTGYRMCFDNLNNCYLRPRKEEADTLKYASIAQKYSRISQKNIIAGANTPFHNSLIREFQNITNYIHLEDWPRYLLLLNKKIDIGFIDRILISYRLGGLTSRSGNPALHNDYDLLFSTNISYEIIKKMQYSSILIGITDSSDKTQMISSLECILARKFDEIFAYKNESIPLNCNASFYIIVFSSDLYYSIAGQLEKQNLAEGENFSFMNDEKICYLKNVLERHKSYVGHKGYCNHHPIS